MTKELKNKPQRTQSKIYAEDAKEIFKEIKKAYNRLLFSANSALFSALSAVKYFKQFMFLV